VAVEFWSMGAAREVTGSRHYLTVAKELFQVDCGAVQGRREESLRRNRAAGEFASATNTVILTHAHYDHCGMLPMLIKEGYTGNIFSTPATEEIAVLILRDSAKIQKRDIAYLRKEARRSGEQFTGEPLYSEEDVEMTADRFLPLPYRRPLWLSDRVQLTYYDAGHIVGSAAALFEVKGRGGRSLRIAFSGDLGRPGTPIIKDPETLPDPDYLVLESTYGDRLHEPVQDAAARLGAVVRETAARGGKIVIPAFAVERTQEIIYMLHLLKIRGELPDIPVFVDSPMATDAAEIFSRYPECFDAETHAAFTSRDLDPFGFHRLHYTRETSESKRINDVRGPAVIIASDGMCEAGRIRHHLVRTINDPDSAVVIVGFMAADTLGRRIVERQSPLRIFSSWYELRARVEKLNAFSAHADYRELTGYVKRLDLSRLKRVFLVHGEPKPQEHLRQRLLEAGVQNVTIAAPGVRYRLPFNS
jgi:metallo-beta-lactamase family protein